MRKLLALMAALLITVSGVQPASAQDAFVAELTPFPENGALFLIEEDGNQRILSILSASPRGQAGEVTDSWHCDSPNDAKCVREPMNGDLLLPPCSEPNQENCIVSLEISRAGAPFEAAQFDRLVKTNTIEALPRLNFMGGSAVSLWSAPEGEAGSGRNFAVAVSVGQGQQRAGGRFEASRFVASVRPYRFDANPKYIAPYQMTAEGDPVLGKRSESFGLGGAGNQECAWNEDGACGILQDFDPEVRVKLTIRMPNEIGGWYRGRIKDPTIEVSRFSDTNNVVTVAAEPVSVARMAYVVPDVKDLTNAERALVGGFAGSWDRFTTWGPAGDATGFNFVRTLKNKVADTAAGTNTFWNFASSNNFGQGSQCLSDTSRVLGIVTTNSMVYDGGVPKFNRGFLDYRVAGLHYEADGVTEVLGSYDLVMRSDVARCLYGFTNAPVSATVTITGEGDSNIATTVVSERNGWLKLAAYGFTFSQKTIKVQLTQPLTRTLNKFSGRTTTLSATQRSQIRTLVTNSRSAKTITCTANFVRAADRATAQRRAKSACDHARSINRNFKFVVEAKRTNNNSLDGRVRIASR